MRNCVSRVTGFLRSASAYPNPSDQTSFPFTATATCTPGMRVASRSHTSVRSRATMAANAAGTLPARFETHAPCCAEPTPQDRKSTRLNSSHGYISYAVFCLKKKKKYIKYKRMTEDRDRSSAH